MSCVKCSANGLYSCENCNSDICKSCCVDDEFILCPDCNTLFENKELTSDDICSLSMSMSMSIKCENCGNCWDGNAQCQCWDLYYDEPNLDETDNESNYDVYDSE